MRKFAAVLYRIFPENGMRGKRTFTSLLKLFSLVYVKAALNPVLNFNSIALKISHINNLYLSEVQFLSYGGELALFSIFPPQHSGTLVFKVHDKAYWSQGFMSSTSTLITLIGQNSSI